MTANKIEERGTIMQQEVQTDSGDRQTEEKKVESKGMKLFRRIMTVIAFSLFIVLIVSAIMRKWGG